MRLGRVRFPRYETRGLDGIARLGINHDYWCLVASILAKKLDARTIRAAEKGAMHLLFGGEKKDGAKK